MEYDWRSRWRSCVVSLHGQWPRRRNRAHPRDMTTITPDLGSVMIESVRWLTKDKTIQSYGSAEVIRERLERCKTRRSNEKLLW